MTIPLDDELSDMEPPEDADPGPQFYFDVTVILDVPERGLHREATRHIPIPPDFAEIDIVHEIGIHVEETAEDLLELESLPQPQRRSMLLQRARLNRIEQIIKQLLLRRETQEAGQLLQAVLDRADDEVLEEWLDPDPEGGI